MFFEVTGLITINGKRYMLFIFILQTSYERRYS